MNLEMVDSSLKQQIWTLQQEPDGFNVEQGVRESRTRSEPSVWTIQRTALVEGLHRLEQCIKRKARGPNSARRSHLSGLLNKTFKYHLCASHQLFVFKWSRFLPSPARTTFVYWFFSNIRFYCTQKLFLMNLRNSLKYGDCFLILLVSFSGFFFFWDLKSWQDPLSFASKQIYTFLSNIKSDLFNLKYCMLSLLLSM